MSRIRDWHSGSGLTVEDGFRVLDSDGDGYLNEKDLHDFLVGKLRYQERELSSVRLQKLMKLMDSYKHGRVGYLDWHRFIGRNADWVADVKQQIGIVLSKDYGTLSDAFYRIANGDKKLVFASF